MPNFSWNEFAAAPTDYKSIIALNSELNKIQDLDTLLDRILLEARRVVKADAGSIFVKQRCLDQGISADKLVLRYAQNDTLKKSFPPGQKVDYSLFNSTITIDINEKSISGYCAHTGNIVNIPDMYNIPADTSYSFNSSVDQRTGYKTKSSLTLPLSSADGRLLGVLQVLNAKNDQGEIVPFTADDEFIIMHFAANASNALLSAFQSRAMILRMTKMSELRDPKETGTHVNRVAGYAAIIYDEWAHNNNVPYSEREKFRDLLRVGAMLHDVGKVAISDTILKKPGRFTPEEFEIMQQHTVYGAALFDDPQSPVDILARDVVLTHHEKWNGTGYPGWVDPVTGKVIKADENGKPLGKKGTEIPLAGRIVAIADVYDALCSKRVYKEPWNEEETLAEMKKMSGVSFDPELMDIFFVVLPNIKRMQSMYPDHE